MIVRWNEDLTEKYSMVIGEYIGTLLENDPLFIENSVKGPEWGLPQYQMDWLSGNAPDCKVTREIKIIQGIFSIMPGSPLRDCTKYGVVVSLDFPLDSQAVLYKLTWGGR